MFVRSTNTDKASVQFYSRLSNILLSRYALYAYNIIARCMSKLEHSSILKKTTFFSSTFQIERVAYFFHSPAQ